VCVVDGAHYTERVFNCKPLLTKKPLNFTSGAIQSFKGGSKDFRKGVGCLKFPVSLRLCQTNPHIDKVKTL
jgi:hypothetical protein